MDGSTCHPCGLITHQLGHVGEDLLVEALTEGIDGIATPLLCGPGEVLRGRGIREPDD